MLITRQKLDLSGNPLFEPVVESFVAVKRAYEAVYEEPVVTEGETSFALKGYQKPVFEDDQIVGFELVPEQGEYEIKVSQCSGGEPITEEVEVPDPEPEVVVEPEPKPPTPEEIEEMFVTTIQSIMDSKAMSYGYDNLDSAVSYAIFDAVEKFQKEGLAFGNWRSLVWEKCYEILEYCEAGWREVPTLGELIAELPKLEGE